MENITLDYYNNNAKKYVEDTYAVDFKEKQDRFLKHVQGKRLLDFGCGSGRDTKYFLEKGYAVNAIDGSSELCKIASLYTGIKVREMLFCELDETDEYDGIWACSSILHLSKIELKDVLRKMIKALHDEGVIYTSFKYGSFEGLRNGRYFTHFTENDFVEYIKDLKNISIEELWISCDVRAQREDEKWLNIILKKTNS